MRSDLVEKNGTAEFVSLLTGTWHMVREMTFWSKTVTAHVLPAPLNMELGGNVNYCNTFTALAVFCMQMLLRRLLLSAEKFAESTTRNKNKQAN